MDDPLDKMMDPSAKGISRRNFIKGVIGSGVAVSSANYLFRASTVFGQAPGSLGERLITLNVNGQQRRVDVMKQETLAHDAALQAGPHRHQARLRPRGMRRLHRPDRRRAALFVLGADAHGARTRRS